MARRVGLSVSEKNKRDDGDCTEVINHRKREQERPQRRRQVRADYCEYGERERDIGGHGNGPSLAGSCVATRDGKEQ